MLSANAILNAIKTKQLEIKNFRMDQLNPNSYDLTLGNRIGYYALYTEDASFINYGQSDMYRTPDMFGHEAAYPPVEGTPGLEIIVQNRPIIDPARYMNMIQQDIPEIGMVIYPGNVYLAMVEEEIYSENLVVEMRAKSSISRAGIQITNSDGYSNLGDRVRFVVEIKVTYPTIIYPNMKIAQAYFHEVESDYMPGIFTYNGRYKDAANAKTPDGGDLIYGYIPDPALKVRVDEIRRVYEEEQAARDAEAARNAEMEAALAAQQAQEVPEEVPAEVVEEVTPDAVPDKPETVNMDVNDLAEALGGFEVAETPTGDAAPEPSYTEDDVKADISAQAGEAVNLK